MKTRGVIGTALFVLVIAMTSVPAMAQSDGADYRDEALQQAAQNPVANMISIPLQNNFNFGVGMLPVSLSLQGYYNVVRPDAGPEWNLRFTIQLMLPSSL
jgi:hypothetical protein